MRLHKDPNWTDAQRERAYQHEIDDAYSEMTQKWPHTGATTKQQKLADLCEGKTVDDGVDLIIAVNVIERDETGEKYPIPILVPEDAEKWRKRVEALTKYGALFRSVRRNKSLAFVDAITVKHGISANADERMIIVDLNAKKKADIRLREEWTAAMNKATATREETVQLVKTKSELSDKDRKRLKNEAITKRKTRRINNE